ncbi:MAG: metallophosphoesterase family protein [Acidobacteria bacterium]|nr:metallophosphoesterase family protein [Acidobacteriota bacterium]
MIIADTIIVSDLHLGSEVSRASGALRMLKALSFNRLILLGDIFSDLNFRRLKKEHWRFLGYIRKLSNPKREIEVVWVEGNHDRGLSELMSHLVGVRVYQEYAWNYLGIDHLAIHGHQFDRFVSRNLLLSAFLASLHLGVQRISFGRQRMIGFMERFDSSWLRLSAKVAEGALTHARSRNVQRIFCGHTHEATSGERDGIEYYNAGSWTQDRATYIAIDSRGVQVRQFPVLNCESLAPEAREEPELEFDDLPAD